MSTTTSRRGEPAKRPTRTAERDRRRAVAAARAAMEQRRRRITWVVWGVTLAALVAIVAVMMATSRNTDSQVVRQAPDFTLTDTSGHQVHLADYRGKTVVLYFSEGAGCQPCLTQMAAIEQDKQFQESGIVVLPIVMNTADQIKADMATNGVTTPFLLDASGSVSRAYGVLGKGMHADLPGHGFVLIDPSGTQRWYGEYPSMYLAPADLLAQIRKHLP